MSALVVTSGGSSGSTTVTYNTTPPTLTNGQTAPLQGDSSGNLLVSINSLGLAVGQKTMAASFPVVLASDQSAHPVNLQDGAGSSVTKGSKVSASSLPVVIASDQAAFPINLQDGAGSSVTKGSKVSASSLPVVIASDQAAIPINLQDGAGSSVTKGQKTMSASLPVVISSDQSALPQSYVSVKNEMDTALLDTSSTNINGSAGAFVQVVSSLGNACKKIRIADTTGQFIGVYTGGAGSEVFAFMTNPGLDDYIEHAIAGGTRVSLRAMQSSAINSGLFAMQFSG